MADDEKDEEFTVSVKGAGVTIDKKVSADVAREVINVLMGGASAFVSPQTQSPGSGRSNAGQVPANINVGSAPGARRTSLREFLDESQATRNPDKITTIAEYLFVQEGAELFTRDDIKGRFRSAGEAPPGNFPRDFSWAVKNGWIAEDMKTPGSFYVTEKGRQAIANRFSEEVKKATAKPSRRRSRKSGTGAGEEAKE